MTNNKILISINKLADLQEYKKIGITNFLFKVKEFSLNSSFTLEEIKEIEGNIYLYFDKILNTKEIENFKKIIDQLSFAKGIFFEDLGIYQILKDTNIPLIWAQSHFVINSQSINIWLKKVNSALLSNELTLEEIKYILDKTSKPLILSIFGHNLAMYSRRYLLSSFNKTMKLKMNKDALLAINNQNNFIANETNDGITFHFGKPFNYLPYLNEINDDKILLYYIDTINYEPNTIIELINGDDIASEERFLQNKTIYKLED